MSAGASIATTGTRLIWPRRRKNSGVALEVITTTPSTRLANSVRILATRRCATSSVLQIIKTYPASKQARSTPRITSPKNGFDVVVTIMPMVRVRLDFSERASSDGR